MPEPSAGAIGGSANEAGSAYRADCAAWIVAHGLSERPLQSLDLGANTAIPISVALEADGEPDDILVETNGGNEIRIQAKSNLAIGRNATFLDLCQQLLKGARDLDGSRGRLVVVAPRTNSLDALKRALDRRRGTGGGSPTELERRTFDALSEGLGNSDVALVDKALGLTHIWTLDFDIAPSAQKALALHYLETSIVPIGFGLQGFDALTQEVRRLAALRAGADMHQWLRAIAAAGVPIAEHASSVVLRQRAVARYKADLSRRACHLDLRSLGVDVAPISLPSLTEIDVDGVRVQGISVVEAALRHGRAVLVGLPGSGKSTALLAIAASECADTEGAFPILVRLSSLRGGLGGFRITADSSRL